MIYSQFDQEKSLRLTTSQKNKMKSSLTLDLAEEILSTLEFIYKVPSFLHFSQSKSNITDKTAS